MNNMINSKKIAEIAGVSRSTVSKVINNYQDISDETREKVLKVIEEYGYVPNLSAQMMAGKSSRVIGLFLYTGRDEGENKKIADSLYYSQLIAQIVDESDFHNYTVNVSHFNRQKISIDEMFKNGSIDGGIIVGSPSEMKEMEELIESDHKIVMIEYDPKGVRERTSVINPDSYQASVNAVEHLLKRGHKNILHISGDFSRISGIQRTKGCADALKGFGLQLDEKNIIRGDFSEESGYRGMVEYLDKTSRLESSAIFAASDHLAIGAMKALRERGYSIPQDISVVGFDNTVVGQYMTPNLSSVDYLQCNIAKKAVETLKGMIEDNKRGEFLSIPLRFIERESVLDAL